VVVATMVAAGLLGVRGLQFATTPLGPPDLPVLPAVGILFGLLPAWAAPVEQVSTIVRGGGTARVSAGGGSLAPAEGAAAVGAVDGHPGAPAALTPAAPPEGNVA
jgi:energy-coupling factor transport system permease protein